MRFWDFHPSAPAPRAAEGALGGRGGDGFALRAPAQQHEVPGFGLFHDFIATPSWFIVLAAPDGTILGESEGVCEGRIALEPVGDNGFGYDPVFYLPQFNKTMAQLPAAQKHQISHRGQAVQAIVPRLRKLLKMQAG